MIELLNIDCIEYMKKCKDKEFDLAIIDPPYGIDYQFETKNAHNGWQKYNKKDWDKSIPKKEFWEELFRVSKNQIVWGGNYFTEYLSISRGWIVWYKVPYKFSLSQAELAWTSFNMPVKVFERMTNMDRGFMNKEGKQIHPTQKPKQLYDFCFENYAEKGQKILDTHLGSASSAISAHYFGVDFVGCEIDNEYYELAKERFEKQTMQTKLF